VIAVHQQPPDPPMKGSSCLSNRLDLLVFSNQLGSTDFKFWWRSSHLGSSHWSRAGRHTNNISVKDLAHDGVAWLRRREGCGLEWQWTSISWTGGEIVVISRQVTPRVATRGRWPLGLHRESYLVSCRLVLFSKKIRSIEWLSISLCN
jgi:hypothetical protein